MYAQDFAGAQGSTPGLPPRRPALRRPARRRAVRRDRRLRGRLQRLRLGPERRRPPAAHRADPASTNRSSTTPPATASCASCTSTRATSATAPARGARSTARREGWYQPYAPAVLDQALRSVAADGNIKFYGGEPTLHADVDHRRHAHPARRRLSRPVHDLLERREGRQAARDPRQRRAQRGGAELLHLPRPRRRAAAGARAGAPRGRGRAPHPNRIFQGYKVLFHAGAGAEQALRPRPRGRLPRPRPRLRALLPGAHRRRAASTPARSPSRSTRRTTISAASAASPQAVFGNYRAFRRWVDEVLDPPRARAASAAARCATSISRELPVPEFGTREAGRV